MTRHAVTLWCVGLVTVLIPIHSQMAPQEVEQAIEVAACPNAQWPSVRVTRWLQHEDGTVLGVPDVTSYPFPPAPPGPPPQEGVLP